MIVCAYRSMISLTLLELSVNREKNSDALMKLLTNEKVEQQVLRRVRAKSLTYGRDIEGGEQEGAPKYKVNADHIVAIYRYIAPLLSIHIPCSHTTTSLTQIYHNN